MESAIPPHPPPPLLPRVVAFEEETKILASVSEAVTFQVETLGQEEVVVPIVKPVEQTLEEDWAS